MILKVVGIKSCRPRLQNTRAPSGSMKGKGDDLLCLCNTVANDLKKNLYLGYGPARLLPLPSSSVSQSTVVIPRAIASLQRSMPQWSTCTEGTVVHSRKHVLLVKPVGKLSPGDETVGWNFACCPMLVTAATNSGSIRFFSPCTLPNRKVGPGHAPFWLSMTPHT